MAPTLMVARLALKTEDHSHDTSSAFSLPSDLIPNEAVTEDV